MSEGIPLDFIANMPKIELHAHLNGSLKTETILELGEKIYGPNTQEFINLTKNFIDFKGLEACFQKFKFMHDLTATELGLRLATQMVIRDFSKDNVIYLELRTTPKCNEHMTKSLYIRTVLDAIQTAEEVLTEKIIVKLLPSIDRSKPIEEAMEMLVLKLRQNSKYLQIIPGIDFSGNPSCGIFHQFHSVLSKARENGLKLTLHCAEIDNQQEIEEMLNFGMERCGHGTFLSTEQIHDLAKRNVGIECCLSSNVKCATVPNYSDHHFKRIIEQENNGISILCTDDSGVFDTTLTNELNIAANTFKLNKQDLIQLQLNAIAHAFTSDIDRKVLRDKVYGYFTE